MQTESKSWRFELTFGPTNALIRVVHQFVSAFYNQVLDLEATEMVTIAAHELMENALKYSAEQTATLQIDLCAGERGQRVVIRLRNRSGEEHIRPLRDLVARLTEHPDPMGHYVQLMRETSKRAEGSGLGLARLRAEAGMDLDLELEGSEVCITAAYNVERRVPA